MHKHFANILLCGLLTLGLTLDAHAQRSEFQKDNPKILASFKQVVSKVSQSSVQVQCGGKQVALGTVVGADGWILTKASELKGKIKCRLKDGRDLDAKIVGIHADQDLALLQVDAKNLTPVDWLESKQAPVGNWVASASTDELPAAVGVVSVATREIAGAKAPFNLGAGGYLGVAIDPGATNARITQIMPKTGAEKAGLKVNDIVFKVGDKPIDNMEAFLKSLQRHKPGDVVRLHVKRGDKEIDVEATLGKRPQGRSDYQNSLGSELSNRRTGFPAILQHDSVLRARDCGGPLVDLDGKTIGINIARAGRTESYAIPSEVIRPLLPDLMSGKLAPPKDLEKLTELRGAIEKAAAERAAADKKLTDAKAALDKADAERAAAEKKLADAKAALERAEKESKEPTKDKP